MFRVVEVIVVFRVIRRVRCVVIMELFCVNWVSRVNMGFSTVSVDRGMKGMNRNDLGLLEVLKVLVTCRLFTGI